MSPLEYSPLRFGFITDIHHTLSEEPEAALQKAALLRQCTGNWQVTDVRFVVQLGDLISEEGPEAEPALEEVRSMLKEFPGRMIHVPGNHCLAVPFDRYMTMMGMFSPYFSFCVDGFRFLVLNGMDVSVLSEPDNAFDRHLLEYYREIAPAYCGAIGEKQLAWLTGELETSAGNNEQIVVFCHLPLLPETTDEKHGLLWNHEAVTAILLRFSNVKACFGGHYHPGGYACRSGIHFIVLPAFAACSLNPGSCCGTIEIAHGRIRVLNLRNEERYNLIIV
jgi:hypothetical protein